MEIDSIAQIMLSLRNEEVIPVALHVQIASHSIVFPHVLTVALHPELPPSAILAYFLPESALFIPNSIT